MKEPCYFCGEDEYIEVFEIWGSDFQFDTCCYESHEAWVDAMNCPVDREETLEYLATLVGQWVPCRQVYNSDSGGIRIDHDLTLQNISRNEAKEFVRRHHRHNPPPAGDRFRFGCYNGSDLVAVAIVGRPVARMIDHTKVVEVNRLCVNHNLDRELTWKACSLLYNASAKEAKARGFEKIITYTLAEEEVGMSLRYARWKKDGSPTKGGSWNRASRPRTDKAPTTPKQRWAKCFNQKEAA